ncbi:alpha-D-ribose 1-methylphosphonate 5-triphosphate diphosphatase [Chelativorans salis]|uniref:Alpha-D-ribose 1-methylphosphonate 5-triphosphate diphosphatase n=1 Tax=Chelativorans salis TaxID=2978478 RepID=A0ABT2LI65_9HYPH|nr:alpha-D-ribose 1-methylphosphonate 5-triphosphate diphosphatase [Chelativorans sp. EGI FJ00035]MCT7373679.1 alpha-D-ribose 1-methylphosphonate 5-triphosphate diphosphatase [Chelativorans sp. EGI FJ00035]
MSGELILTGGRIVLDDAVIAGTVQIVDGRIKSVDMGGTSLPGAIDLAGDYLLPGLVDVHTDHLEKHVFPRAHVRWNMMRAVMSHDAQIVGGGVTTVFDSLCVGATEWNSERREILGPMIDALEFAGTNGMLRAEHLVHLRCEITDEETPALAEANIDREIVRVVSVMEHVPGKRQSRDISGYVERRMAESGKSRAVVEREIRAFLEEMEANSAEVRATVVALAKDRALPLFSHDDATLEHIHMALDEGIRVAEFPVSLEAAREARSKGMLTVAGAPNMLRGGSQSGNVAVHDLLAERLVDILASDYVPRSMLDCAFMVATERELDVDLPMAVRMVTSAPARACGLDDRGEILPGLRADLIRVHLVDDFPVIRSVWRNGRHVN